MKLPALQLLLIPNDDQRHMTARLVGSLCSCLHHGELNTRSESHRHDALFCCDGVGGVRNLTHGDSSSEPHAAPLFWKVDLETF